MSKSEEVDTPFLRDTDGPDANTELQYLHEDFVKRYQRRYYFAASAAAGCLVAVIILSILLFKETHATHGPPPKNIVTLDCGSSPEEARMKGCEFDVLAFLWIPKPCADIESLREYQDNVDWHAYDDDEGTRRLTLDEMATYDGPRPYYTSAREHVVHCAYMWRRMHKQYLAGGLYMDDNARDLSHTEHCADMLIEYADSDPERLKVLETETVIGYSTCQIEA